ASKTSKKKSHFHCFATNLELLSDPPTAASQAAGITGMRHHTRPNLDVCSVIRFYQPSNKCELLKHHNSLTMESQTLSLGIPVYLSVGFLSELRLQLES
uniref:Uncharacterized protein n=1 Tax=Chelydra serpentina TaxID=8475 RepID=A0A8C3S0U4_CHESE